MEAKTGQGFSAEQKAKTNPDQNKETAAPEVVSGTAADIDEEKTDASRQVSERGKKKPPAFAVLTVIALVAAVILAATNVVTKGPIAEHEAEELRVSLNTVLPADEYEPSAVPEAYPQVSGLYTAKKSGGIVGYCVKARSRGFNGDVAVMLGVDPDGKITGCKIGDSGFSESPGYGAKAKEPAFAEQFKGIDAVAGGRIDAISGATKTSNAVLDASRKALACVDETMLGKPDHADPVLSFGK